MATRSSVGVPYINYGQLVFFIRLDEANEFWRIYNQLKERHKRTDAPK